MSYTYITPQFSEWLGEQKKSLNILPDHAGSNSHQDPISRRAWIKYKQRRACKLIQALLRLVFKLLGILQVNLFICWKRSGPVAGSFSPVQ